MAQVVGSGTAEILVISKELELELSSTFEKAVSELKVTKELQFALVWQPVADSGGTAVPSIEPIRLLQVTRAIATAR